MVEAKVVLPRSLGLVVVGGADGNGGGVLHALYGPHDLHDLHDPHAGKGDCTSTCIYVVTVGSISCVTYTLYTVYAGCLALFHILVSTNNLSA